MANVLANSLVADGMIKSPPDADRFRLGAEILETERKCLRQELSLVTSHSLSPSTTHLQNYTALNLQHQCGGVSYYYAVLTKFDFAVN